MILGGILQKLRTKKVLVDAKRIDLANIFKRSYQHRKSMAPRTIQK